MSVRRLLLLGLLGACTARPDRPDPAEFPGADDDGVEPPVPNNCTTLVEAFDVAGSGYVERSVSGFGLYEYRSAPNRQTSIYLRACAEGVPSELAIALHYYGVARIEPGDYAFTRLAEEDGGFLFAFTDDAGDLNCSEQPTGVVTITDATFDRLEGELRVNVLCTDSSLLGRIPRESTFTGTFAATNIGPE